MPQFKTTQILKTYVFAQNKTNKTTSHYLILLQFLSIRAYTIIYNHLDKSSAVIDTYRWYRYIEREIKIIYRHSEESLNKVELFLLLRMHILGILWTCLPQTVFVIKHYSFYNALLFSVLNNIA